MNAPVIHLWLLGVLASALICPAQNESARATLKPYILKFCVIGHEPLTGQSAPVEFVYAGRQIKVASAECAAKFRAEPEKYLKGIENAESVFATAKGFQWIEPAAFEKLRASRNVVVLDVRSSAEFATGHVPGAVNLDVNATNFTSQARALDKSKSYLVHCMAGVRGAKACDAMRRLQFPKLFNLDGGLAAWEHAGYQPVKELSATNQVQPLNTIAPTK
jgi:phage shock protein E